MSFVLEPPFTSPTYSTSAVWLTQSNPARPLGPYWKALEALMMGLADQILALHMGIREVSIMEEKVGDYEIVDEASRAGITLLADRINAASGQGLLAPIILLGTATQFAGQESKIIGIEYENAGLVVASLSRNKLLLLSTELENLNDAMHTISTALPQLCLAK